MFFCVCSCWFVLELVVSSTVCLAVLNLLEIICLEYVNRLLFAISRSKILHYSELQPIASTEREWILLAPPISGDVSFFESMFLLYCGDLDIVYGLSVPSIGSISCPFGIDLWFAAGTTEEAINCILCGVGLDKDNGISVLVINSDPS